MGADDWQPARISDAFNAAEAFNANCATQKTQAFVDDVDMLSYPASFTNTATNCTSKPFKLAISFDMSSFPCVNSNDASRLRSIVMAHSSSSAYLQMCSAVNGATSLRPVLSTFAGEACGFGQAGWQSVTSGFWFAPAFFDMSKGWTGWSGVQASMNVRIQFLSFNLATRLGELTISLYLCSGTAGGLKGIMISHSRMIRRGSLRQTGRDTSRQHRLGFIPYVRPFILLSYLDLSAHVFCCGQHYGPDTYNKNWIYRPDNWLWATRWEQLITNRAQVAMVEVGE